jgi:hypothetical protein
VVEDVLVSHGLEPLVLEQDQNHHRISKQTKQKDQGVKRGQEELPKGFDALFSTRLGDVFIQIVTVVDAVIHGGVCYICGVHFLNLEAPQDCSG